MRSSGFVVEQDESKAGSLADGPRPFAMLAAFVSVGSIGAVAALVRWSWWWPHSDMRQIWATGFGWLAAAVGVATFVIAFSRLGERDRRLLLGCALLAVVLGFVGGFLVLKSVTARAR
ncbi:MAG: hypothetical protein M3O70_24535 [Actinomycetota bacterium]|nr:hypothetical protein [Actinomycetota bacterium]